MVLHTIYIYSNTLDIIYIRLHSFTFLSCSIDSYIVKEQWKYIFLVDLLRNVCTILVVYRFRCFSAVGGNPGSYCDIYLCTHRFCGTACFLRTWRVPVLLHLVAMHGDRHQIWSHWGHVWCKYLEHFVKTAAVYIFFKSVKWLCRFRGSV